MRAGRASGVKCHPTQKEVKTVRFPRRFREERRQLNNAADDVRKARELQRAYASELYRNPSLPLR